MTIEWGSSFNCVEGFSVFTNDPCPVILPCSLYFGGFTPSPTAKEAVTHNFFPAWRHSIWAWQQAGPGRVAVASRKVIKWYWVVVSTCKLESIISKISNISNIWIEYGMLWKITLAERHPAGLQLKRLKTWTARELRKFSPESGKKWFHALPKITWWLLAQKNRTKKSSTVVPWQLHPA